MDDGQTGPPGQRDSKRALARSSNAGDDHPAPYRRHVSFPQRICHDATFSARPLFGAAGTSGGSCTFGGSVTEVSSRLRRLWSQVQGAAATHTQRRKRHQPSLSSREAPHLQPPELAPRNGGPSQK
jgi:hypothetical protein